MAVEMRWAGDENLSVLHFDLGGGALDPAALAELQPPAELLQRRHLGLVLSGRGPVWLYAWLAHWAHPFAWVGTYDPRLAGVVVVACHTSLAPKTGSVVPLDPQALGLPL